MEREIKLHQEGIVTAHWQASPRDKGIVMPGCTFLRCMIDTAMTVKHLEHHIKLRLEFASDLAWWDCFLPSWNSKSMMAVHGKGWNPHIVFSTDASGSWGCGAIRQTRWIQCPWLKEWESEYRAKRAVANCDSMCSVRPIVGPPTDPSLM